MRAVVFQLILLGSVGVVTAEPALDERRLRLARDAASAAAQLGRGKHYANLLEPMPNRVLEIADMAPYVFFGTGWGRLESWGVWSLGFTSHLYLRLEEGQKPRQLYLHGRYINGREATRVRVNDVLLSEAPLSHLNIELPADMVFGDFLQITLEHLDPKSPHDLDPSRLDPRKLKFGLTEIRLN